jgi:hypothetical protein
VTVQRVEPGALTSQAAEMKGQNWHNPAEDAVAPPDAVPSTTDAIANLNANAQLLKEFERWAEVENLRIAEMLEIAAQAYQKVDADYGTAIDNPERTTAIDAIAVPAPQTQPPEIPGPASTPRLLDASGYSNVKQTQAELTAPDTGTSLKTAMLQWGIASKRVENNKPKPPPGDWEGDAADAAYARMTTFGSWLTQLAEAWYNLAEAASKIVAAHDKAKSAHEPIHQEYTELEARMMQLASLTGPHGGVRAQQEIEKIRRRMEELQAQSDQVRQEYARDATFAPVRPADPPFTPADGSTSTGGGAGPGGAGDQPTGDPEAMAQKMAESLDGAQSQAGSQQGGGGSPSGGGGSPSGGASPSAGGSPGGAPGGGPTPSAPKLPTDASLRPAAGSGGGGSGGGSGPGAGAAPLSPAVTPETVAPGPPVPVAAGPAAPAAAPAGMAGGMGGMAPMHGAQGGQQGKEKRRDPRLAPDEDLYVEDRPWTESVVGNRRRKDVQDSRQGGQDDK